MFILSESGGEYEDAWSIVIAVSHDQAKLEALRDQRIEERAKFDTIQGLLYEHYTEFRKTFVGPNGIIGPYEDWPRWAPGIAESSITLGMREIRENVKKRNHQRDVLNNENMVALGEAYQIVREKFLEEAGVPKDIHGKYTLTGYHTARESTYSIEPIEFI